MNGPKLGAGAVGNGNLAASAVSGDKVADGSLTASDINVGSLPFPNPPKSGTTLRGVFAVRGQASGPASTRAQTGVSFGFTLPSAPTVHYINFGDAVPAGCDGGTPALPQADPGNLCIYEAAAPINVSSRGELDFSVPGTANNVATTYGFGIDALPAAAGDFRARGTWAVTVP